MKDAVAESDGRLVARVREGDRGAFDLLVKRHYGVVFAVSLARLGDPEAAEDLVQEVFLRLYLQIAALRDGAQFGAWALRVARNLAVDWQRRGQRVSRVLPLVSIDAPDAAEPADPATGVVEAMQREDEKRLLLRQLDRLPPEQREMVLLHYMEGMSKRDVAERLGVHPSTVGRVIDRALGAMREGLEASLREGLRPPVPRPRSIAKASALAAAVAALPASARAELIAAVAVAEKSSTVYTAAPVIAAAPGFLAQLSAKLAAGAATMGMGKLAATVGIAVVVLGGAGVYISKGSSPRINVPAVTPTNATVAPVTDAVPAGWKFDVRDSASDYGRTQTPNETTFVGEGVSLGEMLTLGWGVTPACVQAGADVMTVSKDFTLVAPQGTARDLYWEVFRAQVQKAWGVHVYTEKQQRDVLVLRAPKGVTSAFAPAQSGGPGYMRNDGTRVTVQNQGLATLARMVEVETWKPVIDETGFQGTYNYQWKGKASEAVTGQFGLALVPESREVEILVVEKTAGGRP